MTDLGRIGGYRLIKRLATGGTSDVILARAEGPHGFERTVVLKRLLSEHQHDPDFARMFTREAAAYARLSHPAIVKLFDFFRSEGQLVMVIEHVDGVPLTKLLTATHGAGRPLDDGAGLLIASRIFDALSAAHQATDPDTGDFTPVIHRDVNPSNVLLPWEGHAKLADFGIAKITNTEGVETAVGLIKGTYGYMAPEQVKGERVTIRTDVYCASLVLWELLAHKRAVPTDKLPEMEALRAMAEPTIPSLDALRPDLSPSVREAVARGLEPNPEKRRITAEEMVAILRENFDPEAARLSLVAVLAPLRKPDDAPETPPPPKAIPREPLTVPRPEELDASPVPRPEPRPQSPAAAMLQTLPIAQPDPSLKISTPSGLRPVSKPTVPGAFLPPSSPQVTMPEPPPAPTPPPPELSLAAAAGFLPATPAVSAPPPAAPLPPPPAAPMPPPAPPPVVVSRPPPPAPSTPQPLPPQMSPLAFQPAPPPPQPPRPPAQPSSAGSILAILGVIGFFLVCAVVVAVLALRNYADGGQARPTPVATRATAVKTEEPIIAPPETTRAPVASTSAAPSVSVVPSASAAPSATAIPSASVAPSATVAVAVPPTATGTADEPTPGATTGVVLLPASAAGHRIFVDGKVKSYTGDAPLLLECGTRSVQIGSAGTPKDIDVPCNGKIKF